VEARKTYSIRRIAVEINGGAGNSCFLSRALDCGWSSAEFSDSTGTIIDPPKEPARRQLLVVQQPDLAQIASNAARVARGGS
jgi:hypothetical protein